MANIYLATWNPPSRADSEQVYYWYLREGVPTSRHHVLVDEPSMADVILFAESFVPELRQLVLMCTRFYWRHAERLFVFNPADVPLPVFPGLYASIPRRFWSAGRIRSGFYGSTDDLGRFDLLPPVAKPELIASFAGSCGHHPVRMRLKAIVHPRFECLDTSGHVMPAFVAGDSAAIARLTHQATELARRSAFVLCPHGRGAGSLRVFEAMKMGRAPVIVSDDWTPPDGPDWSGCSLRMPESEATRAMDWLEPHLPRAAEMGRRARDAWERYFSPERAFDTVVDTCLEIRQTRRVPQRVHGLLSLWHLLRPPVAARCLRSLRRGFRRQGALSRPHFLRRQPRSVSP
jgi:hypothetical protein